MKNKIVIGAIVGVMLLGAVLFLLLGSKTYNVVFDTDGGTSIATQKVKSGDMAKRPSNPKKDGYEFIMWELDGSEYDFTTRVKQNITLKAAWKEDVKKYKVTIVVDGKTETLELSELTETTQLPFENKVGYELKLYLDGKPYDYSTPLSADMNLTGKYEKVSSYTVKFDSDGGSTVASQTVLPGNTATEPTKPTKEAFIFDGWYLNNTKYDFNQTVTKNITLKAKWSEDPAVKRYEVTFNSDGGSAVTKQRIIENKTATKPKDPTRSGYKFVEWQLDNKAYDFSTKVTKDITLKAIWKEIITYKVTFDSDGGSQVTAQNVIEGEKATKPTNPTKSGYTFKEWQLNGTTYDFSKPVTANIELKALWEKEKAKYKVSFNTDGGGVIGTQTIPEGETAAKPANPTKSGYTFREWQLNGTAYNFNTPVTSDIELKATWDEIEDYTLTVTAVDQITPARKITVFKNGTAISFKEIKYTDGVSLCKSPCASLTDGDVEGETSFKVILTDNREVTARRTS